MTRNTATAIENSSSNTQGADSSSVVDHARSAANSAGGIGIVDAGAVGESESHSAGSALGSAGGAASGAGSGAEHASIVDERASWVAAEAH